MNFVVFLFLETGTGKTVSEIIDHNIEIVMNKQKSGSEK